MALPKLLRSREFHLSFLIMAAVGLLMFNAIAFSFDDDFTRLLYGDGINFDDPAAQKAREEATVFAKQIEEESIVLLKNENGILPIDGKKLNVFGYGSGDRGFIHQGGGSGHTSEYAKASFYDSLSSAGLELNPSLVSFYNNFNFNRYHDSTVASLQFRNYELDPGLYPAGFFQSARNYSPYAAVVFSRPATEKLDIPSVSYDRLGNEDATRTTLALNENERFLLDSVVTNFPYVIVIMNSGNAMEASFADDPEVQAILNVGYPGNTGCQAIGEVLLGKINPSGRSVDTFVFDSASNPATPNCGEQGNHILRNSARYVDYAENIYVGYRYYETLFEELGRDESAYKRIVAFPFGHGLSYTSFQWSLLDVAFESEKGQVLQAEDGIKIGEDGVLSFSLWVENAGDVEGRDVVELYGTPPYYRGGIEKSSANLVAFAKTSSLKPKQGELIKLEVPLREMASYDAFDANENAFAGYELEAGDYSLSFRMDAHNDHPLVGESDSVFHFSISENGLRYDKDDATGAQIENRFTTMTNPVTEISTAIKEGQSPDAGSIDGGSEENIRYLTRADLVGTFPKTLPTRGVSDSVALTLGVREPTMESREPLSFGTGELKSITEGFGKEYEDEVFDKLVRSCTLDELVNLVQHAGFGTNALPSIDKPRCLDLDGPCGINTTILSSSPGNAASYPSASTIGQAWSLELCYQYGNSVAAEALALGINGWYAPGANLHRSPLSGRNFEHFSEDPYLSGSCAAYVASGAKHGGLYAYVKHFAADENESGTNGQYHFLTEQALREIYAKPFEIAVKKASVNGIMLSKNRIGYVRAAGSTALIEDLLRKEWGFRGAVITDYYVADNVMDADEAIRAGADLILEGEKVAFDDSESTTFAYHIARAARNAIYCYCETMAAANEAKSLPFDHHTGAKNDIDPVWKPILLAADAVLVPCFVVYGIFIFKKLKPQKLENHSI